MIPDSNSFWEETCHNLCEEVFEWGTYDQLGDNDVWYV